MPPLNLRLYADLNRTIGGVRRISNEGEPMSAVYVPGSDGRPRLTPSSPGEYYVVVCPYCHDTSGHLYVNHRWGVRDPKNGTRNLWLAKCFLSDCLSSWDNRKDLWDRLEDYALAATSGVVRLDAVVQAASALVPYNLPHDFRLLTDLSLRHDARQYVNERDFDHRELVRLWGIGFSANEYTEVPGRLVIPLLANLGEHTPSSLGDEDAWTVVGYQGRVLGEVGPKQPKYLTTHTQKSRLLYGLNRIPSSDDPVVVVEGPTDVWRVGPGTVALLGKDISDAQCKLIRSVLPGRDVVFVLDPEASAEARKAADKLRGILDRDLTGEGPRGRVVVAQLPDERDPAECPREEIWEAVRVALRGRRRGAPGR